MDQQRFELKLSFVIAVSLFVHLVLFSTAIMPLFSDLASLEKMMGDQDLFAGRDIIVNVNQDNRKVIDQKTLLSDKDSSARGYITAEQGNKWLNNSLEFTMKHGKSGSKGAQGNATSRAVEKLLLAKESEISVRLSSDDPYGNFGFDGTSSEMRIPDKWDITRKNALFYNNEGRFSYNTAQFKDFQYIRAMKNKIAAHWYPPVMANSIMFGYAPGYTRIMAIPSQEVKLYFVMDRSGEVKDVKIVDSLGNEPLDKSCVDAIALSKNFGPVPEDMKGPLIVIRFIFGYYVR